MEEHAPTGNMKIGTVGGPEGGVEDQTINHLMHGVRRYVIDSELGTAKLQTQLAGDALTMLLQLLTSWYWKIDCRNPWSFC